MKSYYESSVQVINKKESKILFSKNCSDSISDNMSNKLSIKSRMNFGKYMGITIFCERVANNNYQFHRQYTN